MAEHQNQLKHRHSLTWVIVKAV